MPVQIDEVTRLEPVVAHANLQVWVGDYAQDVPGGGPFTVTREVVTAGREVSSGWEDSTEETDRLWLDRDPSHTGPLFVNVEDAVADFWDQVPEGTLV